MRQRTSVMLRYQRGALPGSPATAATWATGHVMTRSTATSTSMPGIIPQRLPTALAEWPA